MRVKLLVTALVFAIGGGVAVQMRHAEKSASPAPDPLTSSSPTTDVERLSYSLGALFGSRMKEVYGDLDSEMIETGINEALAGKKLALSQAEIVEIVQKAQMEAAEKAEKKMLEEGERNIQKAMSFLKENSEKPDVMTTESGLQYKILTEGKGAKPTLTSEVKVNYLGKHLDGTSFDSSYERGKPATFRVNQVIRGWTEALQSMSEGSIWELYVPSELAYGPGGHPGAGIGPNELLVFKVELIEVVEPASG